MDPKEQEAFLKDIEALTPDNDMILDEAYEPIQGYDRFIIKNLAGDKAGVMDYLYRKHPNSDFAYSKSGDIIAKDIDDDEWRKLDPSSLEFSDVSDLATDIGGGVAETGAALASGTAGAFLTGGNPMGALAAGSLGAGATAGGLNLLKQKIAQQLGLRGEMDMREAGIDAAISTAMTPLFGLGGKFATTGGKQVAKKEAGEVGETIIRKALKEGVEVTPEATLKAKIAGEGLIGTGLNETKKAAGQLAKEVSASINNTTPEAIEFFFKHGDEIKNLREQDLVDMADDLHYMISESLESRRREVSNFYEGLKNFGVKIDITDTLEAFKARHNRLKMEVLKKYPNNVKKQDAILREMQDAAESVFGEALYNKNLVKDFNVEQAIEIDKLVRDVYEPNVRNMGMSQAKKDAMIFKNKLIKDLDKNITSNIDSSLDMYKGVLEENNLYTLAKTKHREYMDLEKGIKKYTKDADSLFKAEWGAKSKSGPQLLKVARITELVKDLDLQGPTKALANTLEAYKTFVNPKLVPPSGAMVSGTAAAGGTIGAGIGSTMGPLGAAAGAALGAGASTLTASPFGTRFIQMPAAKAAKGLGRAYNALQPDRAAAKQIRNRGVWNSLSSGYNEEPNR